MESLFLSDNKARRGDLSQHAKPMPARAPYVMEWGAYQCDLMFIPDYARENSGLSIAINLIHMPSRFLHSALLGGKDEAGPWLVAKLSELADPDAISSVTRGLEIKPDFRLHSYPISVRVDSGTEFLNRETSRGVSAICYLDKVNKSAGDGVGSLAVVERVNRTIRDLIERYVTRHKTTRYAQVYDQLIEMYNRRKHSGTSSRPVDLENLVPRAYAAHLAKTENREIRGDVYASMIAQRYPVGTQVRLLMKKRAFTKSSKPGFSARVYTVTDHAGFHVVVESDGETRAVLYNEIARAGEQADTDNTMEQVRTHIRRENVTTRLNKRGWARSVGAEVEGFDEAGTPVLKARLLPANPAKRVPIPSRRNM